MLKGVWGKRKKEIERERKEGRGTEGRRAGEKREEGGREGGEELSGNDAFVGK